MCTQAGIGKSILIVGSIPATVLVFLSRNGFQLFLLGFYYFHGRLIILLVCEFLQRLAFLRYAVFQFFHRTGNYGIDICSLLDTGGFILKLFRTFEGILFRIIDVLELFVVSYGSRVAAELVGGTSAEELVDFTTGTEPWTVGFRTFRFQLVGLIALLYGLVKPFPGLLFQYEHLDIVGTLFHKRIVPFAQCLVVAERFAVCTVEFGYLFAFLLLASLELLYGLDYPVHLKPAFHECGIRLFFHLIGFPHGFTQFIHSVFPAKEPLYPFSYFFTVYHRQRNKRRQCRLRGEQRSCHLFPYRGRLLSCGRHELVFLAGIAHGVRKHRDVVGYGQEEHLRPHGQRGKLPGDLCHGHSDLVQLRCRVMRHKGRLAGLSLGGLVCLYLILQAADDTFERLYVGEFPVTGKALLLQLPVLSLQLLELALQTFDHLPVEALQGGYVALGRLHAGKRPVIQKYFKLDRLHFL